MKYLLILLFFNSSLCFTQDFKNLYKTEVAFILFDEKNESSFKNSCNKNQEPMDYCFYNFITKEQNPYSLKNKIITLVYNEFMDFDQMEKNNPVFSVEVNKSFIRKNKDIIITSEFINHIGFLKSSKLLRNAKTIILIEKSDKNNNKIIMREVILFEQDIE